MRIRMRATVRSMGDRVAELRTATNFRRDLWAHSPVEVDPEHPLRGTHRDEAERAYFEFATEHPAAVRRVIEEYKYTETVELNETPTLPGKECVSCGNVSGPVPPTVCPNCGFRDITPCPVCGEEVSRESYIPISGNLFRCPRHKGRVRLRYNTPMFLPDGSYNQPLVVVDEAGTTRDI